jgi:hypothetical protein
MRLDTNVPSRLDEHFLILFETPRSVLRQLDREVFGWSSAMIADIFLKMVGYGLLCKKRNFNVGTGIFLEKI